MGASVGNCMLQASMTTASLCCVVVLEVADDGRCFLDRMVLVVDAAMEALVDLLLFPSSMYLQDSMKRTVLILEQR